MICSNTHTHIHATIGLTNTSIQYAIHPLLSYDGMIMYRAPGIQSQHEELTNHPYLVITR